MLWAAGAATLSEAHAALKRPIGYTTVQTRLNRLVEKRIVTRTTDRPARYAAAVGAGRRERPTLGSCCSNASAAGASCRWWRTWCAIEPLSAAEITELKKLISEAERNAPRPPSNASQPSSSRGRS